MKNRHRAKRLLRAVLEPVAGILAASVIFGLALLVLAGCSVLIAKAVECIA